jgi:hypothetical protein
VEIHLQRVDQGAARIHSRIAKRAIVTSSY